ncbi:tetratricopeptide repeat protein [Sorangium sp. So ce834]|uniref:tetratricopeptide repeat protein n=1 Tax=Sorangium sp. So ce834 TaxID=3133321 RepID=UPI003F64176A
MNKGWFSRAARAAAAARRGLAGVAVAAIAACAAACGGAQDGPREPLGDPLLADPPDGSDAATSKGTSTSALDRGVAYIKNERYEEAKPHLLRAIEHEPGNAEAHYYLGLAHEKTNDRAGAEASYKKALERDPKLEAAALNLAALYLDEPARPDEAIAVLAKAIEQAPGRAALHQNLGYAYGLKRDVANASKHYEAALKAEDSAATRFAYGAMLFEAKELDRAAAELKKALAATGDDVATIATIGRMLGPAKAYADCVAAFDRAIKLKPEAEFHVRRGTCRHELGDEQGARADYQAAIKVDPKFAAAHYYLGLSFLAERKPQSALAALTEAGKHGGDTEIGKRARAKVKELSARLK